MKWYYFILDCNKSISSIRSFLSDPGSKKKKKCDNLWRKEKSVEGNVNVDDLNEGKIKKNENTQNFEIEYLKKLLKYN